MANSSVKIDIFKVMGDAWSIFSSNFFKSILGCLAGFAVIMAFHVARIFFELADLFILKYKTPAHEKLFAMLSPLVHSSERFFLFLEIFVICWIAGGLCVYFLKMARGGCPCMGDLFIFDSRVFKIFIAAFLVSLGVFAGFLCCVIPSVILVLFWSQTLFLIVDRGCGPVDAMRKSAILMNGNKFRFLVLLIILSLISLCLNFCTCFIAVIVIVPWMLLVLARFYSELEIEGDLLFK